MNLGKIWLWYQAFANGDTCKGKLCIMAIVSLPLSQLSKATEEKWLTSFVTQSISLNSWILWEIPLRAAFLCGGLSWQDHRRLLVSECHDEHLVRSIFTSEMCWKMLWWEEAVTVRFESSLYRVMHLGTGCIFLPVPEISYVYKIMKLELAPRK